MKQQKRKNMIKIFFILLFLVCATELAIAQSFTVSQYTPSRESCPAVKSILRQINAAVASNDHASASELGRKAIAAAAACGTLAANVSMASIAAK